MKNVKISITGTDHRLIIGEGVKFVEGGRIRIEDKGNQIIIGDNSDLINVFLSSADNNTILQIGRDCLFSSDVIIRTSDSHSILNDKGARINNGASVIIGDHVWICNGVRVMKGSSIGDNSIVGSSCIVAGGTIGNNQLAVGNPHRVIKSGVSWSHKRI